MKIGDWTDLALGKPTEGEALKSISFLAGVPGALVGMAPAVHFFVSDYSPFGVWIGAMAGGGLCGCLIALGLVRAAGHCFGFASVAWIPLCFGGASAGLIVSVAINRMTSGERWRPSGVIVGTLAGAGILYTYWLRARRAR